MKNSLGYGALGLLSLISMNAWSGAYEDWANATELMRKQDYKGAILLYDRAIASKEYSGKHLGQLYHMRGKAKLKSHGLRLRNDEALIASAQSDLDQSVQLDPGSHGALIDRGVTRSMLEDHKGAVDDYTAALTLKSNDFQGLMNRCLAFEKLNRRDEAIADCKKALEIDPNHWQPKGTLERLGQMSQPQPR